ncbi:hypothetical protein KC19_5G164900 [Ceratodon purpureus]|uniref:Secreted peptide n=1 Tax=Ceratodon purpureus TaxID=3225 RepID=A0A8T0I297_CERPU|nr:hypothetical protein KC19_5G164900 [Ceratodon purpureus]
MVAVSLACCLVCCSSCSSGLHSRELCVVPRVGGSPTRSSVVLLVLLPQLWALVVTSLWVLCSWFLFRVIGLCSW